ncbi:MAG: CotH kinase family protein [Chloroflexi bacterium]|nr:CotH kinase family protein [Chloroflexota bacterium]MCI0579720.1 CotH kinase family protein [Chloroflexota bacterium]MCI0643749.1 CotH kinase family protein [Chloroflexota bacterium]MCI0728450.1 CotH kinase family protein [Chloroflexota bacterium]
MKIGQQPSSVKERRFELGFLALILLVAVLVLFNRGSFQPLSGVLAEPAVFLRSLLSPSELPTLVVDVDFLDYETLQDQRQEAVDGGAFLADENDFVPATMRLIEDGAPAPAETPVRIRLPAGLPGSGDKWPFEVRTRDNQLLLGMQRFSLQDPAANNWLNQWAFARSLEQAGLLAARYSFVHLVFNGADRGVYALQEGFGPELLAAYGRPAGVVVEYDTDRLWEAVRYFSGDAGAALADPIANPTASDFLYFEVDTFRDATIAEDPELTAQKNNAIGLLRALQAGEAAASQVFDVEQYSRFLALVDLWGASEAVSLVNLRYYYNPDSGRLEPIGYNGNPLHSEDARLDPGALFDDPALQAAYVQAAQEMSRPEYLDQLQAGLDEEWQQLQQALAGEAELAPPWEALRQRQELIHRSLNPLQPVFAYLGSPTLAMSATIQVDVANVLNLPVEVVGFDIGGATFLEANPAWIVGDASALLIPDNDRIILRAPGGSATPTLRFVRFHLPLIEIQRLDSELDYIQPFDILVATRVIGQDEPQLTLAREGYPETVMPPAEEP